VPRHLFKRVLCLGVLAASTSVLLGDAKPITGPYSTDLQNFEPGKPPEELFILNGGFEIVADGANKVLELPGDPLDSFGVLFGAENLMTVEAGAKIHATNAGKMFPEFGVGTNDSGGWRVWVLPGQDALILRKKETEEVARVPYKWTSGTWTSLKLRVTSAGEGKWNIEGKAWASDQKEPEAWTIKATDTVAPPAGRASIWGHPYAGTPIRFDDLSSTPVAAK
jgi:hypothetical protein